jgi:hypothetical protein
MLLKDLLEHLRLDTTINLIDSIDRNTIVGYTTLRKTAFDLNGTGSILDYYDCRIDEVRPLSRFVDDNDYDVRQNYLEIVVRTTDLDTCSHEYEYYGKDKNFAKCKKCGELVKANFGLNNIMEEDNMED